ncbi:tetratricopeptide repeat protein [Paludisphaera borealis]|uniref:Lipoprotein NlpI n=1 Tax=Paludisphaera borealis TaxID=1387353 RepID=A0A1U7CR29_9BACT|nr:tetratricopeptide repeat protein [Paludisphaera borealis]APW61404.1 Lipoprotein NlpI [Paludisphaera borealis]
MRRTAARRGIDRPNQPTINVKVRARWTIPLTAGLAITLAACGGPSTPPEPDSPAAYNNRGNVWLGKKEYEKANGDFNEAIRLDPGSVWPRLGKALVGLSTGREEAVADARLAIEAAGWKDENSIYATIVGHLGARRVKKDDVAKEVLDEADRKADKSHWPYPVVKYLRREIDEKALLALATDDDKMTEARCYLGIDQMLSGRPAEARENFLWVKEHGTPGYVEVPLAVAELDRLETEKPAGGK